MAGGTGKMQKMRLFSGLILRKYAAGLFVLKRER
jgi:hypothetical protein